MTILGVWGEDINTKHYSNHQKGGRLEVYTGDGVNSFLTITGTLSDMIGTFP